MIIVKLTRDETRCIQQYFFPYLDELCKMKERQAVKDSDRHAQHMVLDLYKQAKKVIDRKLLTTADKFSIRFTDSQAIILHQLLLALPLDAKNIYLVTLRQLLCNVILKEINAVLFVHQVTREAAATA